MEKHIIDVFTKNSVHVSVPRLQCIDLLRVLVAEAYVRKVQTDVSGYVQRSKDCS